MGGSVQTRSILDSRKDEQLRRSRVHRGGEATLRLRRCLIESGPVNCVQTV